MKRTLLRLTKASVAERNAKVTSRLAAAPSLEEFFAGGGQSEPKGTTLDERYPVPEVKGKSMRTTWREERLPKWLTYSVPRGEGQESFNQLKKQLKSAKLATICQEGNCPNIGECWGGGKEGVATATIMLMGDTCTRACRFCSVKTSKQPPPLDAMEPENTAESVSSWNVGYIVMTMVDRDDLADGGSQHVALTVRKIKEKTNNKMLVECLVGDFQGKEPCIRTVAESGLDVYAHNIETVESQTKNVRDRRASYWQSIKGLEFVKKNYPSLITKSAIMLGVGEKEEEIRQSMRDLRNAGVDCLTIGQYLQPNRHRMKVSRYADPKEFEQWREEGEKMGFLYVASGPKVRSSYKAGEYFMENIVRKRKGKTE